MEGLSLSALAAASLVIWGLPWLTVVKQWNTRWHILWHLRLSILLQERSDLLGCTNWGRWLYSTATIRRFCYESSARWLLWDIAIQDFCVHWWTHFCGRGELLLKFIILSYVLTAWSALHSNEGPRFDY